MYSSLLVASFFGLEAAAFPFVLDQVARGLPTRQDKPAPGSQAAIALSKARGNCGVVDCLVFDEKEQFVDTTSDQHKFIAPKASDIRGPCPGLNAAANHNYLNRNGITTIANTATGLAAVWGLEPSLGALLAVIAIGTDGDPVTGTWSIGGTLPQAPVVGGLLGQGLGLSYSHNTYEGDASIARGDYHINGGDAHSLIMPRFIEAFKATSAPDRYTLDSFAEQYQNNVDYSIANNPYAFWAPFSGIVAPAAYLFAINFFSNHSAEEPSGYLDGAMFKSFFAVEGDQPENFVWNKGMERIPDNWYRRTSTNQYNLAGVVEDLGVQFLAYPKTLRFGGNLGKVNTYEGVNLGDLTGGVITNSAQLMDPNTLACFVGQFMKAGVPDAAAKLLNGLSDITAALVPFNCPAMDTINPGSFNKFPGSKQGPAPGYETPQALPY